MEVKISISSEGVSVEFDTPKPRERAALLWKIISPSSDLFESIILHIKEKDPETMTELRKLFQSERPLVESDKVFGQQ